jgi:membrane-associated phospholipid phosphatase
MSSEPPSERDLGPQPIAEVLRAHGLEAQDLVAASTEQLTHKMVARACKGRRLTANVQGKLRRALQIATGEEFGLGDLFTYSKGLCAMLVTVLAVSCSTAPQERSFVGEIGADLDAAFVSTGNLLILGGAFASGLFLDSERGGHAEEKLADYFDGHDFIPDGTGNALDMLGSGIFLLGASGAWYGGAELWGNPADVERSAAMLSSLGITGVTTLGLKAVLNDGRPDSTRGGYPSGHSSMAMAAAASLGESFGWKVGVPAYTLAGLVAVQRLDSRMHDLDDVIGGLALGYVIGSSVTARRLPGVAGGELSPIYDPATGEMGLVMVWEF